jgi:hypothetical protein
VGDELLQQYLVFCFWSVGLGLVCFLPNNDNFLTNGLLFKKELAVLKYQVTTVPGLRGQVTMMMEAVEEVVAVEAVEEVVAVVLLEVNRVRVLM